MNSMQAEQQKKQVKPLSGYNIFYQMERCRLLSDDEKSIEAYFSEENIQEFLEQRAIQKSQPQPKRKHRKTHGKLSFKELAKITATNWKSMSAKMKNVFNKQAEIEKEKFERQAVKEWYDRKAREKVKNCKVEMQSEIDSSSMNLDESTTSTCKSLQNNQNGSTVERHNQRCHNLEDNDVLIGRGVHVVRNKGNIRFRRMIHERIGEYIAARHQHAVQAQIARTVIAQLYANNGRFLSRDHSDNVFCVVQDKDFLFQKTRQAFRDEVKKQLRSNSKKKHNKHFHHEEEIGPQEKHQSQEAADVSSKKKSKTCSEPSNISSVEHKSKTTSTAIESVNEASNCAAQKVSKLPDTMEQDGVHASSKKRPITCSGSLDRSNAEHTPVTSFTATQSVTAANNYCATPKESKPSDTMEQKGVGVSSKKGPITCSRTSEKSGAEHTPKTSSTAIKSVTAANKFLAPKESKPSCTTEQECVGVSSKKRPKTYSGSSNKTEHTSKTTSTTIKSVTTTDKCAASKESKPPVMTEQGVCFSSKKRPKTCPGSSDKSGADHTSKTVSVANKSVNATNTIAATKESKPSGTMKQAVVGVPPKKKPKKSSGFSDESCAEHRSKNTSTAIQSVTVANNSCAAKKESKPPGMMEPNMSQQQKAYFDTLFAFSASPNSNATSLQNHRGFLDYDASRLALQMQNTDTLSRSLQVAQYTTYEANQMQNIETLPRSLQGLVAQQSYQEIQMLNTENTTPGSLLQVPHHNTHQATPPLPTTSGQQMTGLSSNLMTNYYELIEHRSVKMSEGDLHRQNDEGNQQPLIYGYHNYSEYLLHMLIVKSQKR